MRAHEFDELLHKRMSEKGYEGKEIDVNGGFMTIKGIVWCDVCDSFHILVKSTIDDKEY